MGRNTNGSNYGKRKRNNSQLKIIKGSTPAVNKRKKVRRGERTKKHYNKFGIYYVNIRGVKSKVDSLQEIIDSLNPVMICLTETHLGEDEQIGIKGYKVFDNNRNGDGGGILIAIKDEIAAVTVEIKKEKTHHEALWLRINNGRTKIRVGVIYAPQENKQNSAESEKMYDSIEEEIKRSEDNESILIIGDLNCKVGDNVEGNNEEITKRGKVLMKLINRNNLELLNNHVNCSGTWTRIQKDKKSVIDYGIIKEEDSQRVMRVHIDEEKIYTPYRIAQELVYTDHCAMIIELNWRKAGMGKEKEKYVIDMEKLREHKGKNALMDIVTKNYEIAEKYSKWQAEISNIYNKCKKKLRTKETRRPKIINKLMKSKRIFKKKSKKRTDEGKKRMARAQEILIDEYIIEEKKRQEGKRIKETVEDIKSKGGVNSPAFWDFKSRMDRKSANVASAVKGVDGRLIEDTKEILKEYEAFYKSLFVSESPIEEIESLAEEINHMFHNWLIGSDRITLENGEETEAKTVERIISQLKNKFTPDCQGISNMFIKCMGKEMVNSVAELIKQIEKEFIVPGEWEKLKILSLHKKGSKQELNNRRGIFITSNISKIFEKARMEVIREKINESISRFQCGGLEGCSTVDHLLTLNAVVDYHKYIGASTYIFFADAYKCFDKLDLNDCVCELGKMVGWKEALWALKMNKNGKVTVECPLGTTSEFEIKDNVRQGTIYGPMLCGIATDQINVLGRKNFTLIRNIEIESLIFVDD